MFSHSSLKTREVEHDSGKQMLEVNQEWTIQRHRHHWVQETKQEQTKTIQPATKNNTLVIRVYDILGSLSGKDKWICIIQQCKILKYYIHLKTKIMLENLLAALPPLKTEGP